MKTKYAVLYPLTLIIFLLPLSLNVKAQDKASEMLKQLQNKINSLKNITADFTQSFNGGENLKGKFYYQKNDKMRVETGNIILVSDGSSTWNYNRVQKKLIISSNSQSDQSLLSLKTIVNSLPPKCNIKSIDGNDSEIILTPKEKGLTFNSIKIYVNQNNLINALSIETKDKQTVRIELSNYKLDSKLPDSLFKINPPKGSKVIDLR